MLSFDGLEPAKAIPSLREHIGDVYRPPAFRVPLAPPESVPSVAACSWVSEDHRPIAVWAFWIVFWVGFHTISFTDCQHNTLIGYNNQGATEYKIDELVKSTARIYVNC